jgi:hypothetical protein
MHTAVSKNTTPLLVTGSSLLIQKLNVSGKSETHGPATGACKERISEQQGASQAALQPITRRLKVCTARLAPCCQMTLATHTQLHCPAPQLFNFSFFFWRFTPTCFDFLLKASSGVKTYFFFENPNKKI